MATANLAVAPTDAPVGNTVGGPAETAVVWPSLVVAAWPTVHIPLAAKPLTEKMSQTLPHTHIWTRGVQSYERHTAAEADAVDDDS